MPVALHRRTIIQQLAAGAAAVAGVAAAAGDGGVDAKGGKRRNRTKPIALFKGTIADPVYTPVGGEGSTHYLIESGQCEGRVWNCRTDDHREMSANRLFRYLERRSGGVYNGKQTFRLQGINWRLEGVERNPEDGHWRIHARVCDTNPDARPENRQAAVESDGSVRGCDCGCQQSCYNCCARGFFCGKNQYEACGRNPCG